MVDLPRRKVGVIACSGEDLPEGTISRVAARMVLDDLRPGETVTLCLPLFLAGDEKERAFARSYPTIAVDGCGKLCAKRATEKYSGRVSGSIVVDRLLQARGLSAGNSRRELDRDGRRAVAVVAAEIAQEVGRLLRRKSATEQVPASTSGGETAGATCCAGPSVPITQVNIEGVAVGLAALEPIFEQLYRQGRRDEPGLDEEILKSVKMYNYVPPSAEELYQTSLMDEYEKFCRSKGG
jgi:uncharacterized metal-binding protein